MEYRYNVNSSRWIPVEFMLDVEILFTYLFRVLLSEDVTFFQFVFNS